MATGITPESLTREQAIVKLLTGDLLTREQAAAYLNIRPQTLAVWHTTGRYQLPLVKVGRAVRYRRTDLDRFIEARTVGEHAAAE